jgi:TetR/AcrR family transcriptional regulator
MSTRRAPRATVDRILDAAEIRFAAKGYDATSLGDVADDVGIRTPSLYKHFASKQLLWEAVLARLLDPYFALLGELLVVPADAAQAEKNLDAVLSHYLATPRLAELVQHAALAGGAQVDLLVKRWYGPLFKRAGQLSTGGQGDPVMVVVAFHSMMSGYVTMAGLHARLMGKDPRKPASVAAFRTLMRGLARGLWVA